MPVSPPKADEQKKPSLDRSIRVSPKEVWADIEPFDLLTKVTEAAAENPETAKNREFCPVVKIRSAASVGPSSQEISRYDFVSGCGRWTCPVCGPKKRWKLIKRIALGTPNRFMTLTTSPLANETPRACFVRTSKQISKLFRWIKKTSPEVRFARILESTKRGFPHYHFALHSKWISQKNLSNEWEKLTGAKIVDIRKLFGKHVQYLAKYVTKNDAVEYTRQRISFSRNWPKLETIKLDCDFAEWETIHNEDIPRWAFELIEQGRTWDANKNTIAHIDKEGTSDTLRQLAAIYEWDEDEDEDEMPF